MIDNMTRCRLSKYFRKAVVTLTDGICRNLDEFSKSQRPINGHFSLPV